jgi:hypothetical protein
MVLALATMAVEQQPLHLLPVLMATPPRLIQSVARPLAAVVFFALAVRPVLLLGIDGPWLGPGTPSMRTRHDLPARFRTDFFTAFDSWFADRIGLRLVLIRIGTGFHVGVLQRPTAREVVFGLAGWMFWPDDGDKVPVTMADVRGHLRLEPEEIRQIGTHPRAIRERLAACGRIAFVVVAPNKQSIYPEYLLGDRAPASTRLDDLLQRLDASVAEMVIDPRPELRTAKVAPGPRLYNKTDTHWNQLGAFHVYRKIVQAVERAHRVSRPELASLAHYDIVVQRYEGGDLAVRMLFSRGASRTATSSCGRGRTCRRSPPPSAPPAARCSRTPRGRDDSCSRVIPSRHRSPASLPGISSPCWSRRPDDSTARPSRVTDPTSSCSRWQSAT